MGGQRTRTRVAEGVYADQWGLAATVKVGTTQREARFPTGQSLDFIQAWRARTRADLLEDREARDQRPEAGTVAADIPAYLRTIAARVSVKSDRSHIRAWIPALGTIPRHQLRLPQVQAVLDRWRDAGLSARTLRHRRRVLRELYLKLDGPHARPPTAGATLPTPPAPHPVPVSWAMVQQVAASLLKGKRHNEGYGGDCALGRARFLVLATTGQRPTQVMRAEPGDVDLTRKLWYVRAAKGGVSTVFPLDAEALKAWKVFITAEAWGPFNSRSFAKLLRRHGWPVGVRPYQLRHTLAIDMILGGADMSDVQAALGHKQIGTTQTHYAGVQLARTRKALTLRKRGKL